MLSNSVLFNMAVILCALGALVILFQPRLLRSTSWRATVTPLASIIGSGFLVIAPLLHHIVNGYSTVAMLLVVLLAYTVGGVMRYNIRAVEPRLNANTSHPVLALNEQLAHLALALAYLISVAFYLRLMASFVLQTFGAKHDFAANVLTTGCLLFILSAGWWRGLSGLEKLEEAAVHVKLAIILALLIGLAVFDLNWALGGGSGVTFEVPNDTWHTLRLLGGVLLIVQGFETSRYISDEYDPETRIKTMRRAQLIAAAIYLVFVTLAVPALAGFDRQPNETAIIDLGDKVAVVLPAMLILAAVMSQFSASIADTLGAGGLLEEASRKKIRPNVGYVIVCSIAIVLIWIANIFEIISLASRAFAFYYAIQCLSAIIATAHRKHSLTAKALRIAGFAALGTILLLISVFALPAGQ